MQKQSNILKHFHFHSRDQLLLSCGDTKNQSMNQVFLKLLSDYLSPKKCGRSACTGRRSAPYKGQHCLSQRMLCSDWTVCPACGTGTYILGAGKFWWYCLIMMPTPTSCPGNCPTSQYLVRAQTQLPSCHRQIRSFFPLRISEQLMVDGGYSPTGSPEELAKDTDEARL